MNYKLIEENLVIVFTYDVITFSNYQVASALQRNLIAIVFHLFRMLSNVAANNHSVHCTPSSLLSRHSNEGVYIDTNQAIAGFSSQAR